MLELFRPFVFLTIRHPSRLPLWVNWVLPLVAACLAVAGLVVLRVPLDLYGTQGLLERLLAFVQTLVGFYVAALAAVCAFNSVHLDQPMPSPAPTMKIRHNGALQEIKLTRRRFLTSMFAFLTALSFAFSLLAIAVLTLAEPAHRLCPAVAEWLRWPVLWIFLFMLFQLSLVTFWGLFYLGERMLTPD